MNKNILSKTPVMWLVAVVCCLLWGSAFPAIKIGYQLFNIQSSDTATIILFAGIRFALAGILTLIIFSFANKSLLVPTKKAVPKILNLSLFQTILQYLFFYLGLAHTTGVKASVVNSVSVFVALFVSSLVFKLEKLNALKIVGSVIGFVGVVLINISGITNGDGISFFGEGFIFLSAVSYAFSSVFMKIYSKNYNPSMLSGWQFVFGGVVMIACGLALGGSINAVSAKAVLLLLYLALVSAVAYSLWSILLKYNTVSKVAVCGFMTPVFGFILSAVFLSEKSSVGVLAVLALAFVVLGIFVVNYDYSKNKI
jgi:drug/metabolite transporter (DMT)-like permease